MKIKIISVFILAIFIYSCDPDAGNFRKFYFPADDLSSPKVYEYQNLRDNNDKIYYALKSINKGGQKFLHIEVFNQFFDQYESYRVRLTENGAFADEYISTIDSSKLSMKIYADTILLWKMKKNDRFMLEVSANRPELVNQLIIKKIYQFTGVTGEFALEKFNHNTIELYEEYFFNDGTNIISSKNSTLNYARDLGLVSFEIRSDNDVTRSYKLNRIMNFTEWKNLRGY